MLHSKLSCEELISVVVEHCIFDGLTPKLCSVLLVRMRLMQSDHINFCTQAYTRITHP